MFRLPLPSATFAAPLALALTAAFSLTAEAGSGASMDLTGKTLDNPTAYIPSQCYTKTEDATGKVHNPCFICHVRSRAPNYINDFDLQLTYAFPAPAQQNPWTNLFVDRSKAVAATSDADILTYVRESNYRAAGGDNLLAARLADVPPGWDYDKNGRWDGFIPDVAFNFDDEGFDIGADGRMSGWRAFAYAPLPGSFWPTNGSTDDVLIRLPAAYRQDADGREDRGIYKLNLAVAEALIKRTDVPIEPTDETVYGVDLDKDGKLATADHITFDFAPLEGRTMSYVGRAKVLQDADEAPLAAGLYPLGTEFLHTVRYIDIDDTTGEVRMAPRLKELRYMAKTRWQTYADREDGALAEAKETYDFPDRIALFDGNVERGISNGTGWRLSGFIEDAEGALRPQTFEETVFCMGCHGGIGETDDDTFAFPRKLGFNALQHGWSHWTQGSGLRGVNEPVRADGTPEYAAYLAANGAGDDFRGNSEIRKKFFDKDGGLDPAEAEKFRHDVAVLLYPSRDRALALDKAYRLIVREQSFTKGRDATITPAENVHRKLAEDQKTGVEKEIGPWYPRR